MTTKEQWREFADGFYEVSDRGRVRRAKPGRGARAGCILKDANHVAGYRFVTICVNGKPRPRTVHSIVAEAFIGPRPDGLDVNHIDGDKTNNNADNLEYLTRRENMEHAISAGLTRNGVPQATVDRIRYLRSTGMYYGLISIETGVSESQCQRIATYEQRKPL